MNSTILDLSTIFQPSDTLFPSGDNTRDQQRRYGETSIGWEKAYSTDVPALSQNQQESVVIKVLLQPEYLSPVVARADIIIDSSEAEVDYSNNDLGFIGDFSGFRVSRRLLVRIIPRNSKKDNAVDESIWVFQRLQRNDSDEIIIVIVPHILDTSANWPFYFPNTRAIAIEASASILSIHRLIMTDHQSKPSFQSPSGTTDQSVNEIDCGRTQRMLKKILELLKKRFESPHYIKRVHHDTIVSREKYQNMYQNIKAKHADRLCQIFASNGYEGKGCREVDKIFEELGIASFCICLWEDMYGPRNPNQIPLPGTEGSHKLGDSFVGFVDLGCGSGVLTDVLLQEGWLGYGFDARRRKVWRSFDKNTQSYLVESILMPYLIGGDQHQTKKPLPVQNTMPNQRHSVEQASSSFLSPFYTVLGSTQVYHSGSFPEGSFLICNHGDELTAWTPLLASLSRSPFIILPCCSFNLAGRRFRADLQRQHLSHIAKERKESKRSTYQSLIDYIEELCIEMGFAVSKEWLRIPSTRNLAIIGQETKSITREKHILEELVQQVILREGGEGWKAAIEKAKEKSSHYRDGHRKPQDTD